MDWGQLAVKEMKSKSLVLRKGKAGQGILFQPGRIGHSLSVRLASEEFGLLIHQRIGGHEESGRNQGEAGRRSEGN